MNATMKTPKCPRDVKREHFEDMLDHVPAGARLLRSRLSPPHWRDFSFALSRPLPGYVKPGDTLILSCVRKFTVRRV